MLTSRDCYGLRCSSFCDSQLHVNVMLFGISYFVTSTTWECVCECEMMGGSVRCDGMHIIYKQNCGCFTFNLFISIVVNMVTL
mmetsp:Transcript_46623/g.56426  ORF Transcript_46623/g.56426 Transcript_46623/m.56426 type:complete len:83 (+) Transcript_46623:940-1188(+)